MPGGAGAKAAAQIAKQACIGTAGVSGDFGGLSLRNSGKRSLLVFSMICSFLNSTLTAFINFCNASSTTNNNDRRLQGLVIGIIYQATVRSPTNNSIRKYYASQK